MKLEIGKKYKLDNWGNEYVIPRFIGTKFYIGDFYENGKCGEDSFPVEWDWIEIKEQEIIIVDKNKIFNGYIEETSLAQLENGHACLFCRNNAKYLLKAKLIILE